MATLEGAAEARGVSIELRLEDTLSTSSTSAPRDAHGLIGGPESYELVLTADGRMVIAAAAPAGLFYGTRTALQLLQKARGHALPPLRIVDAPVSAYRGVMIDNVRSAHNASFHMQFI